MKPRWNLTTKVYCRPCALILVPSVISAAGRGNSRRGGWVTCGAISNRTQFRCCKCIRDMHGQRLCRVAYTTAPNNVLSRRRCPPPLACRHHCRHRLVLATAESSTPAHQQSSHSDAPLTSLHIDIDSSSSLSTPASRPHPAAAPALVSSQRLRRWDALTRLLMHLATLALLADVGLRWAAAQAAAAAAPDPGASAWVVSATTPAPQLHAPCRHISPAASRLM